MGHQVDLRGELIGVEVDLTGLVVDLGGGFDRVDGSRGWSGGVVRGWSRLRHVNEVDLTVVKLTSRGVVRSTLAGAGSTCSPNTAQIA